MGFRNQLFRKVTIIGVGLIGGSLGMAIKKKKLAHEVTGVSRKNSSLVYALKNKAIDKAFSDIQKAVNNADFVILAAPVASIINLLSHIGPFLKRKCIVTDVGSTKAAIVDAAEKHLPAPAFFVGSHPLAGSEKKGALYAAADLFQDSACVMTPTKITNRLARDKVKYFWTEIGAKVTTLSPEDHDKILAYISHLPHVMAYGLMQTIPSEFYPYAAQSLRDMTRIASSSSQMWNDICLANAKHIVKSLDEFAGNISTVRKSIISKDEKKLIEYFEKAKNNRDQIDKNE